MIKLQGHCPACGEEKLIACDDGKIICGAVECPNELAVNRILEDASPWHMVAIKEEGYACIHPLIERIDMAMLDCAVERWLQAAENWDNRYPLGNYLMRWDGGPDDTFQAILVPDDEEDR